MRDAAHVEPAHNTNCCLSGSGSLACMVPQQAAAAAAASGGSPNWPPRTSLACFLTPRSCWRAWARLGSAWPNTRLWLGGACVPMSSCCSRMSSRRPLMIDGCAIARSEVGLKTHGHCVHLGWVAGGRALDRTLASHCHLAGLQSLQQRPLALQVPHQAHIMSAALSTRSVRAVVASAARLQPALRTLRAAWAAPRQQQVQQQRGAAAARVVRASAETETAGAPGAALERGLHA